MQMFRIAVIDSQWENPEGPVSKKIVPRWICVALMTPRRAQ